MERAQRVRQRREEDEDVWARGSKGKGKMSDEERDESEQTSDIIDDKYWSEKGEGDEEGEIEEHKGSDDDDEVEEETRGGGTEQDATTGVEEDDKSEEERVGETERGDKEEIEEEMTGIEEMADAKGERGKEAGKVETERAGRTKESLLFITTGESGKEKEEECSTKSDKSETGDEKGKEEEEERGRLLLNDRRALTKKANPEEGVPGQTNNGEERRGSSAGTCEREGNE